MERFLVQNLGVREESGETNREDEPGFWVTILAENEWGELPGLLSTEEERLEPEWLEELSMTMEKGKTREGSLEVHPRLVRLALQTYYVCYRDIDEQGNERAVRFFLTPSEVFLIGWAGMSSEQLGSWAKRRILETPLDLAQVMGFRVLKHHQIRLEELEDQMDQVEEKILARAQAWQQKKIILFHRRAIGLKKSLNAHQSVFIRLANINHTDNVNGWQELLLDTQRDLDNVRQAHELVENLREAYQAAVDNRANDIMKLLTLLASILLPINLLTSFFGMNFDGMPLIHESYGVTVFYGLSLVIVSLTGWYLWKKKWLK